MFMFVYIVNIQKIRETYFYTVYINVYIYYSHTIFIFIVNQKMMYIYYMCVCMYICMYVCTYVVRVCIHYKETNTMP